MKVPELESKGVSIRLTVTTVVVGIMGMYINLAPYGLNKLKEECTKAAREINSLAMQTWGVKSCVVRGQAVMAYPVQYGPMGPAD